MSPDGISPSPPAPPIPSGGVHHFFLYGLEERETGDHFLHVEAIEDRLEVHYGNVRPHLHRDLHQVMMMQRGAGELLIEETWHAFRAPVLIVMPPGVVHGFHLADGTGGPVITLAERFHREISVMVEPALAGMLDSPHLLPVARGRAAAEVAAIFARIDREYRRPQLAHTTALTADMAALFVAVARLREAGADLAPTAGATKLFDDFLQLVEANFTRHWTIAAYAERLATTQGRLNAACRRAAHAPALEIVHARLVTEARRLLLYSMMNVGEIAYALGFRDPAYFSRFFRRRTGMAPGAFRARRRAERIVPAER